MTVRATGLRALFVAYLAATALHLGYVVAHEPFAFDAWNIARDTAAQPFTASRFAHYVVYEYTHSNPRVGQPFTYLAYKLTWFAPIVTPIIWLVFVLALVTLGIGRFPSWRRGRDLALYAIALGFTWFAMPQVGKWLFCRAYCDNYVYGAAVQLWFLVPLRLTRGDYHRPGGLAAYALAGVLAGMCNEHTGPTLVLFMLGYAWWRQRTTRTMATLAWAGAIGAVVGFAAIFFAPGQNERYDGAATKVSLIGRVLQRAVTGNLDIFRDFVVAAAPVLAVLVVALVIGAVRDRDVTPEARQQLRRALIVVGLVAAAGSLITMTVFVSPKLGTRFFLHATALLLAAFIGVADAVLTSPRRLLPFVVLALAASGYAGARTVPMFTRLAEQGAARIATLEASRPGTVLTVDSYEQVDDSWWFLGDDFRDSEKIKLIDTYFDLAGVILRAVDLEAPLGVSDVRLIPRYVLSPPGCLDAGGGLVLGAFRGLDAESVQRASLAAVDALRARLPAGSQLDSLDVEVEFLGTPPPLPRPQLVVGRWRADGPVRWQAYAGKIERRGRGRARDVALPKSLLAPGAPVFDIYIYLVGAEARKLGTTASGPLQYAPWRSGAYWALACDADRCFVIAATRQTS